MRRYQRIWRSGSCQRPSTTGGERAEQHVRVSTLSRQASRSTRRSGADCASPAAVSRVAVSRVAVSRVAVSRVAVSRVAVARVAVSPRSPSARSKQALNFRVWRGVYHARSGMVYGPVAAGQQGAS